MRSANSGRIGWLLIHTRATKSFCLMFARYRRIRSWRWPSDTHFDYLLQRLGVSLTRESARSISATNQISFLSPPNSSGVKLSGND